jgi:hypothetical protein
MNNQESSIEQSTTYTGRREPTLISSGYRSGEDLRRLVAERELGKRLAGLLSLEEDHSELGRPCRTAGLKRDDNTYRSF